MDVADHYRENEPVYDHIDARLQSLYESFASASRAEQRMMLQRSLTFAVTSVQTAVRNHEQGYCASIGQHRQSDIADGLLDAGVNYYKNKAKYIFHNLSEPDYDRILNEYEAGNLDKCHRAIADECLGVGLRKAGFTMAMVMTDEKLCLDTHVRQFMGLEEGDIYSGVVVEKYEAQCDRFIDSLPDEVSHLSRFMKQWVAFDAQQGVVTTHDPYFLSFPQQMVSEGLSNNSTMGEV